VRSARSIIATIAAVLLAATAVTGTAVVLAQPAAASVSDEAGFTAAWTSGATTTIDLANDITLTCTSGTPTRSSTTAVTVDGHGHTLTQSCAAKMVLEQTSTGSVTLENLTVTGGQRGGLFSDGPVSVDHGVFTGNSTTTEGGAVSTGVDSATVSFTDSAVTDNSSLGSGGAISSQGLITVTRSTFNANTSGNNGGALRAYGGATIVNSTFSDNTATNGGGAIEGGPVSLVFATMVGNTGHGGANVDPDGASLTSFASVIAKPTGAPNCGGIDGGTTSNGYNVDDDGSCGFGSGTGDKSDLSTDLQLGTLADNGGPGLTMLPAKGSPLVDAVALGGCESSGITTDERGVARPQDGTGLNDIDPGCDIGAVELEGPATTTTTASGNTTTTAPTPAQQATNATPAFTG
jgi:predicted outer membrane repeat protein